MGGGGAVVSPTLLGGEIVVLVDGRGAEDGGTPWKKERAMALSSEEGGYNTAPSTYVGSVQFAGNKNGCMQNGITKSYSKC